MCIRDRLSQISYGTVSLLKDNKRTDYPGKEIAMEVEKKWNSEFKDPINVVLGDEWTAGNLSYHLKSRPVWEGSVDKNKLDNIFNQEYYNHLSSVKEIMPEKGRSLRILYRIFF